MATLSKFKHITKYRGFHSKYEIKKELIIRNLKVDKYYLFSRLLPEPGIDIRVRPEAHTLLAAGIVLPFVLLAI